MGWAGLRGDQLSVTGEISCPPAGSLPCPLTHGSRTGTEGCCRMKVTTWKTPRLTHCLLYITRYTFAVNLARKRPQAAPKERPDVYTTHSRSRGAQPRTGRVHAHRVFRWLIG